MAFVRRIGIESPATLHISSGVYKRKHNQGPQIYSLEKRRRWRAGMNLCSHSLDEERRMALVPRAEIRRHHPTPDFLKGGTPQVTGPFHGNVGMDAKCERDPRPRNQNGGSSVLLRRPRNAQPHSAPPQRRKSHHQNAAAVRLFLTSDRGSRISHEWRRYDVIEHCQSFTRRSPHTRCTGTCPNTSFQEPSCRFHPYVTKGLLTSCDPHTCLPPGGILRCERVRLVL